MILPDDVIRECLLRLSPREERAIRLRYGLTPDGREHTYQEIGGQYGVCGQRARQIENKALQRLRHPRIARLLREIAENYGIYQRYAFSSSYQNFLWWRDMPKRHYVPEWKKRNDL